ncbi:MAG TPA: isoprenylcysteine carboxylmethyltransferase family protein [Planctomycetota bacterium]|nr:isoprenylcysteine carboxylmethyltransferase family protein [Planctomycetota bacterium]
MDREHGALGRLGQALVRKRGIVLAPLFLASTLPRRAAPHPLELWGACSAVLVLAWLLRMWAMGYRNWVRGPGERHLMTRGPYALLRHPRYLANFTAGLAWFVLVWNPFFLVGYVVLYGALLAPVIVREEEKLAQDYPGFAEWRANVPAFFPALWRLGEVRAREPGEGFVLRTVWIEPFKLLGALAAFALLAKVLGNGLL